MLTVARKETNTDRRGLAPQRITRRRELPLEHRLAYDFYHHLQRLLDRLGLSNCCVEADWHAGKLKNVRYQVGRNDRRPNLPAAKARRVYSPDETRFALELRLARLLKHCNVRFGGLAVEVEAGDIDRFHFTESYAPRKEDFSRFFVA